MSETKSQIMKSLVVEDKSYISKMSKTFQENDIQLWVLFFSNNISQKSKLISVTFVFSCQIFHAETYKLITRVEQQLFLLLCPPPIVHKHRRRQENKEALPLLDVWLQEESNCCGSVLQPLDVAPVLCNKKVPSSPDSCSVLWFSFISRGSIVSN